MKILIVEDDRDYRALLYELLHSMGHDIMAVSDALHAVALLDEKNNGIDLVVLDLNMPRLGGNEIMETYAGWSKCHARFIIMSGCFDPERYKDHPKVIGCLHKPITNDALREMVIKAQGIISKSKSTPPIDA
jgi:Response regulator containing CheY-like receiver, AAA-type ATPase, and DNA-binding domains